MSEDQDPPNSDPLERTAELPVEKFTEELERMMLAGHSTLAIDRWALMGYQVNRHDVAKFKELIKASWAVESMSMNEVRARREALRVRYFEIAERALAQDKFLPAIKALDSIAELDGLVQPDVNLTQINMGQTSSPVITNGVRERIRKLTETMQLRAEQRGLQNAKIIDVSQAIIDRKKEAG